MAVMSVWATTGPSGEWLLFLQSGVHMLLVLPAKWGHLLHGSGRITPAVASVSPVAAFWAFAAASSPQTGSKGALSWCC